DALIARFARHGAVYLCINRFLPTVRGFFFVAAGLARLPPWKVLAFGAASALAWNLLLFALGATVGTHWERLRAIAETYAVVATGVLVVVALGFAIVWWRRRRTPG
ncbi:MAG TPA: DedA family protein, partial [Polyangia bacterium]|nr:DedA family protein [Polyangia bacterium]